MSQIVEMNIQALVSLRKKEELSKSTGNKIADAVTKFTGSMMFVILHLFLFGLDQVECPAAAPARVRSAS
jgi:uncharacterized membrane protein